MCEPREKIFSPSSARAIPRNENDRLLSSRFLYPGIVSLLVSSVSFPLGLGQFMAGDLNTHDQVHGLFTNFSWTKENLGVEEMNIVKHWSTQYTDVFGGLLSFVLFTVSLLRVFLSRDRLQRV